MSRCAEKTSVRAAALVAVAATMALTGCSDIYYDRRETVSSGGGDAVASNIAVQTIDPWPRYVGNTRLVMNGDRAVLAAQRYRTNQVIPPRGTSSNSAYELREERQQRMQAVPAPGGAPAP